MILYKYVILCTLSTCYHYLICHLRTSHSTKEMQKLAMQEPKPFSTRASPLSSEFFVEDSFISDMDHFIETLSSIDEQDARPDVIGSIITRYASKWLPELGDGEETQTASSSTSQNSSKSFTASWMKKKFFIEGIVGILPIGTASVPCNFLLRLIRVANMVGVSSAYLEELEKCASCQLDQASLRDLMIPSFSHDYGTLLDIGLVIRLVMGYVRCEDPSKNGNGLAKVAKLVDCYLAEIAADSHLKPPEFEALASAMPSHARSTDDGLYCAIDTFLKMHPDLSKQEKKRICNLINTRKLSADASFHAAQNERLPVRLAIQVLLSEQTKLYSHIDLSASFSAGKHTSEIGLDCPGRCSSKRGMNLQHMEIQRLNEDVQRLQRQCMNMEMQIEKLLDKKKGLFGWKNIGFSGFRSSNIKELERESCEATKTPLKMKQRLVRGRNSSKWRRSIS